MIDHVPPLLVHRNRILTAHEALAQGIPHGACIECGARAHVVATGISTPRFAHSPTYLYRAAVGREAETQAHRDARTNLTEIIQEMLVDRTPWLLRYRCPRCGRSRRVNLLAGVSAAVTGRTLRLPHGTINPDVGLIRRESLIGAVEIVATNPTGPEKMAIFRAARIPLIEIGVHAVLSKHPAHPWIAQNGRYQAVLHRGAAAAGAFCRVHWHPPSCARHDAYVFRRASGPQIALQEVSRAGYRHSTNRDRIAV